MPWLGAIGVLLARRRNDRGTRELQALFTEAAGGSIDRDMLVARGWSRERADDVLLDALAHGLLTDESGASLRPGQDAIAITPRLPRPAPGPQLGAWAPPLPPITSAPPTVRAAERAPPIAGAPDPMPARWPADPPSQGASAALAETRSSRTRSDRPRPASQTSTLTGRVLKGTYLVEEQLGQGGMGAVFAARHVRTGRRLAIKTLLPSERVSREAILRFEREARAASAIGHSGIVAVHDFDRTEDGPHYLVMDLLSGETLEARLGREGRLEWPVARKIALEIADALEAAHCAGVLHRDLKPANVFLASIPGSTAGATSTGSPQSSTRWSRAYRLSSAPRRSRS